MQSKGLLKSLLQHHSSKASVLCAHPSLWSHPYLTAGKTIALTVWTFVGKVMSLLFNTLSKFVRASLVPQTVKNLPAKQETKETQVQSLDWEDPLEKEKATHSSILAWRIPWTI